VEHLVEKELARVNGTETGPLTIGDFVETVFLPFVEKNRAAPTAASYRTVRNRHWKAHFGSSTWDAVKPQQISAVLEHLAQGGASGNSLSQVKGVLRAIWAHAEYLGVTQGNPVGAARWVTRTPRPRQPEYTINQVQTMMSTLEPVDTRAALAIGLGFYCALRSAEIRGLRWEDISEGHLTVRRTVWHGIVGRPKTEASQDAVPIACAERQMDRPRLEKAQGPCEG
jgi:integrase